MDPFAVPTFKRESSFIPDEQTSGFVIEPVPVLRYGSRSADPHEASGLILSMIPTRSRVLDIGCGSGELTVMIRDLNSCDVIGLEPDERRAQSASEKGLAVQCAVLSQSTVEHLGLFDVLVFADVLEHVAAPADMLKLATRFLKPGGAIVASIPNVAHWSVRLNLLQGRFNYEPSGLMDATHLRWFTATTVRRVLEAAGMRLDRYEVSLGAWMPSYTQSLPWRWLSEETRHNLLLGLTQHWPQLFGCQHVFRAVLN